VRRQRNDCSSGRMRNELDELTAIAVICRSKEEKEACLLTVSQRVLQGESVIARQGAKGF